MFNLFPDQVELIDKAAASMRGGCKALLLQAATGSGKSVMASELVRRARLRSSEIWFTVPRRDLIKQMGKTFQKFGMDNSFIAQGWGYDPNAHTFICSTGTLVKRLATAGPGALRPPRLAIIDETHFGGEGMDTLIKWLKLNGCYIIGLSATPWKLSGQGLGCWYDEMICGPSIRWLIDNKRLCDYLPYRAPRLDLSGLNIEQGDYAKKQLAQRMENDRVIIGNAAAHYKQFAMGKLNITYCVSIAHSQMTSQIFNDAGIPSAHLDGKTPDDEKRRIILAYARRELRNICNNELLTFGFDLASQVNMDVTIESESDLAPTKSLSKQMQKWGRVLRYKDFPAHIFDHVGNISEHGNPCWDRDWTLESREKDTREPASRNSAGRMCAKCFYIYSPHLDRCPDCGLVHVVKDRTPEEIEGQLQLMAIEAQEKREKLDKRRELGMCKTLKDLRDYAAKYRYRDEWIHVMAKAKKITK